jgi:hypothetical protein
MQWLPSKKIKRREIKTDFIRFPKVQRDKGMAD